MIVLYLILFTLFSFYSFSGVDLNLNLSKNETYLWFENNMKQLGYFNRSLSFWIFIAISLSLIILYVIVLRKISKDKFSLRFARISYLLLLTSYFLSYPAFLSYDIFNYLFDARIVVKYHENPYLFSAQRYVFDEWLRFMRWTHRAYPYGPIWLTLTIIPVALGFGKLVPTIFFFKIFNLIIFLGCIKLIKKITADKNNYLLFALHPIVIYDFLISMHNEGLMLFFLLASIYFFAVGEEHCSACQRSVSILFLLLSIGVKFLTIIYLPIFILLWLSKITEEKRSAILIKIAPLISLISLIPLITLREAYSWYFIIPIGLLTLSNSRLNKIILVILSFLILRYAPFILIGEYNHIVLSWQNGISFTVLGVLVVIILGNLGNSLIIRIIRLKK